MAYTYILQLANGQYYVGSTCNLRLRLSEHEEGLVFFTKVHRPLKLVYYEQYATKAEAAKREYQIKGWSRRKKEALITGDIENLKKYSSHTSKIP